MKFLYDTGASSSFISLQTWETVLAKLPPEEHPIVEEPTRRFRAVDGQTLNVLGKAMLKMVIDGYPVTGLVWIGDVAEEAILGLDFMEAFSCNWDWNKRGLQWKTLNTEDSEEILKMEMIEEAAIYPSNEEKDPLWFLHQTNFSQDEVRSCWRMSSSQQSFKAELKPDSEDKELLPPGMEAVAQIVTTEHLVPTVPETEDLEIRGTVKDRVRFL